MKRQGVVPKVLTYNALISTCEKGIYSALISVCEKSLDQCLHNSCIYSAL